LPLLPSIPNQETTPAGKETQAKGGNQVTLASGKGALGLSMSVRQKARDQKSQYYQAQVVYEGGQLSVKQGENIIEKIEEVV
jgi:hypothetical protein